MEQKQNELTLQINKKQNRFPSELKKLTLYTASSHKKFISPEKP